MNPRNHQIGKLVLKLEFDSEQAANELQQTFTGTFESQVKTALDEVLSTFSNNGETIVIDHLKINLGKISLNDFAGNLKKEVQNSLQKLLNSKSENEILDEVVKIPASENSFEILIFFLKYGHFPWWAGEISQQQLEYRVMNITSFYDSETQSKFIEILNSSNCQQRLAVQFSEDFNRYLISKFYPENAEIIFKTFNQFKNILTKIQISIEEIAREWPVLVWSLLIENKESAIFKRQFPAKILSAFCDKFNLDLAEVSLQLQNNQDFKPAFQDNLTISEKKPEKSSQIKPEKREPSTTEIIITNAGLVIFWPFLQQLFKDFYLLEGNGFLSDFHHEKAVLLTQFLVTGELETAEFQLPLNKIIVGWPIEKPIVKAINLDENEKVIVEIFLKEIIKNWPSLKNTSIAGLRETFLQRNGILRSAHEKWSLKIERKTVDILRDSLPWPISIIKLPWMDKILYVEW